MKHLNRLVEQISQHSKEWQATPEGQKAVNEAIQRAKPLIMGLEQQAEAIVKAVKALKAAIPELDLPEQRVANCNGRQ